MNNIFQDSQINLAIRQGLRKINFTKPTPVQEKVIPLLLNKKSVVVQAATGSGKTHAYLIPIFNEIDAHLDHVQAIVTAPSRELAEQLYQVARKLRQASGLQFRIAHLAGGTDRARQVRKIAHNKPQLVIATPGRLLDFVQKKIFAIDHVQTFIIDEADMTLDMGFLSAIDFVVQRLPKAVVYAAFSATIPVKLSHFLAKYMPHSEQVVIANPAVISPTVKNDLLDVGASDREELLYRLLTLGQPYLALVFANTKETVDDLTQFLQEQGLKVAKIHGGITERQRKRTLRQVKDGQFQYVVATDLAARGLDIPGVSLVINYQIPRNLEFMIHRIGRTGRNGMPGHAITLVQAEEMGAIAELEKTGVHFDLVALKNGRLVARKERRYQPKHETQSPRFNPQLVGYVKKEKKKRKPGYKKKIRRAIREDKKKQHQLEQRHRVRKAKRLRRRRRQQGR